jgi:ketosteroid isomerase-like protein
MGTDTSSQLRTVERVFELFNRLSTDEAERHASPVTAELLDLFDEDVEFTQPALQPEGAQVFKGREALRDSWDRWFEVWEEHRSHPQQARERGPRVLACSRNQFRGRDGIELEQNGGTIFTFAGAKIVRIEAFFDQETATAAFEH